MTIRDTKKGSETFSRGRSETTTEGRSSGGTVFKSQSWSSSPEGPISTRDREAFSDLLKLAETVQAKNVSLRRTMIIVFSSIMGFITTIFIAIAFVVPGIEIARYLSSPTNLVVVSAITSVLMSGTYWYQTTVRQARRERRAFEEVMTIVHEVFNSQRQEMTPIEEAEIKIRLSRLDN